MNHLLIHCPIAYELWSMVWTLVSFGLCHIVLLIYFRVGKVPLVSIKALIYGGLSLIVSYGEFGENGTQDVLKGRNSLFWILRGCWVLEKSLLITHHLIFIALFFFFFLIGNQKTIINEKIRRSTSCS